MGLAGFRLHCLVGRRLGGPLVAALALAAGGCGFHPVGSTGQLPRVMTVTYVQSGEPYGNLENVLRRAIIARGGKITENPVKASAVLDIMHARLTQRVLAVNSRGRVLEYGLVYRVRFRLLDAQGRVLIAPQDIKLRRNLAYNVNIELGSSHRQTELLEDMQRESVELIMLRLEALARDEKRSALQ